MPNQSRLPSSITTRVSALSPLETPGFEKCSVSSVLALSPLQPENTSRPAQHDKADDGCDQKIRYSRLEQLNQQRCCDYSEICDHVICRKDPARLHMRAPAAMAGQEPHATDVRHECRKCHNNHKRGFGSAAEDKAPNDLREGAECEQQLKNPTHARHLELGRVIPTYPEKGDYRKRRRQRTCRANLTATRRSQPETPRSSRQQTSRH